MLTLSEKIRLLCVQRELCACHNRIDTAAPLAAMSKSQFLPNTVLSIDFHDCNTVTATGSHFLEHDLAEVCLHGSGHLPEVWLLVSSWIPEVRTKALGLHWRCYSVRWWSRQHCWCIVLYCIVLTAKLIDVLYIWSRLIGRVQLIKASADRPLSAFKTFVITQRAESGVGFWGGAVSLPPTS